MVASLHLRDAVTSYLARGGHHQDFLVFVAISMIDLASWLASAVQDQWRSWIMLASVVIAALAAGASACSAYFAYLSSLHK